MELFYYSKMNKMQQAAYHAICQGVLQMEKEIQVPRMSGEELYNVFFQMRLDHPEIFWATGFKYRYYQESPNIQFLPEYLFDQAKVKEHQKAMKSRVEKLARPAQKLSESEKEKYIHDFICENVKYDKLKKPYSHEIIGPLGQGVGVCEGIAKAVKVLCEVKNLTYQKLFQILAQEMNYTTIVLNLGSRFMGFFELLGSCQKIFLMKSRGGLGQWREKEFLTEIQKRGEERLSENLREIQLPLVASPVVSCERLVEQWKWNEFGDSIRRMMPVG